MPQLVVNMNNRALINIGGKLKVSSFELRHAPYLNRYLQGEERETVEPKLKILKRELKYKIGKLIYINNFVFADPQKKEAYAHCTHLQIAPADTQTEICKRVQFLPDALIPKYMNLKRIDYVG